MLAKRESNERGFFENEWLRSFHSFSFSDYYDPKHMHFNTLRVINHDVIAAASGFPTHPHRDMEIMTYVLRGVVQHKDSLGNKEQIRAGEVQIMSAGRGILHSEENPSSTEELELLQIWIIPEANGLNARYAQKLFTREQKLNQLRLLASRNPKDDSLQIFQDIKIYGSILEAQNSLSYQLAAGRGVWIQVAKGGLQVNGVTLNTGDGIAIEDEKEITIKATQETDFVLFDSVKFR